MRISRLYIKIYLYFIGVILITFIISTLIFFYSVDRPYKNMIEKRMYTIAYTINSSLSKRDLKSIVKEISLNTEFEVTFYDKNGHSKFKSPHILPDITPEILQVIDSQGFYMLRKKTKIFYLAPFYMNGLSQGYICIFTDLANPKEKRGNFLLWLIISSVLFSILIYPLAIYITKPVEKITEKALKFARGDFSDINESDRKQILGDEISTLESSFSHMARELVNMIENKKELLSDISHELGSPLSRIKVAVELIKDKVEANKIPSIENINGLSDDVDEMTVLVKELLELSKMDVKSYKLDLNPCNIEDIVANTVKSFENLARKNKISINVEKIGTIPELSLDGDKISRVVKNLLSNAIKYSPENSSVKVIIKSENAYAVVSVIDEGPGIGKENGEKIFTPFFREDPSRTRGTGGTGLGLAIAKKIIDLHGGKIWVENPGEGGAHITFRI